LNLAPKMPVNAVFSGFFFCSKCNS